MTDINRNFATEPMAPISYEECLEYRLRDRLHIQRLRAAPKTIGNRLALGLALVGPGLLVMLGDNDAGGVMTYAQTGATYGLSLFIPMMIPLGFIAYATYQRTPKG